MTWAEVSPFLGLLALAAWGLWLRHRTMVKAMEHGYTQIGSEPTPGCHTKPQPGTTPPPPSPRLWESSRTCREKPTPKESGPLPQPGDK